MDTVLDEQPLISSKKHMQLISAPVPSSYISEYEGETNAMVTKPHLEEEKSSRVTDKPQDAADSGKPSKKPRHRHSPAQLAALNELFEKSDRPSLEDRNELAERLGMESKTVHAWFQNKRASTKKRNKGGPSDSAPVNQGDIPEDAFKASPPSALPSIASLLNDAPSLTSTSLNPPHSTQPRLYSSSRRTKRKDLHSRDVAFPNADAAINHNQHDHSREGILESSFFAGPQEFFSIQDKFISHNRGPDAEDGAVPSLLNGEMARFPPETDSRFVSENDGAADGHPSRKGRTESSRMRTSSKQAEELRRAYAINAHPTRNQRQELANRIGMRFQSVTNWFQNQRSQAKKHKDEPRSVPASSPVASDVSGNREHLPLPNDNDGAPAPSHWNHPAAPPRGRRPSLALPENGLPPLQKLTSKSAIEPLGRMSLPPSHPLSPRTRRSVTPYARDRHTRSDELPFHKDHSVENVRAEDILARNRRSRPQPHQLRALKQLLRRTSTPSMEERTALALEIGMDVGRVTNWFRNVRQTARKRAKQARDGSSSRNRPRELDTSSGSSACDEEDAMDLDYDDLLDREIDDWSEEECQEAVTPSSGVSQSPPPAKRPRPHIPVHRGMESISVESMGVGLIEPGAFQELEKAVVGISNAGGANDCTLVSGRDTVTGSGVTISDALLLLSFHQHVVH